MAKQDLVKKEMVFPCTSIQGKDRMRTHAGEGESCLTGRISQKRYFDTFFRANPVGLGIFCYEFTTQNEFLFANSMHDLNLPCLNNILSLHCGGNFVTNLQFAVLYKEVKYHELC